MKPEIPPIDTYSAQFYLMCLKTNKQSTAIKYDQAVTDFLAYFKNKRRPEEFSTVDVLDWRQHMLESGVRPRTVTFKLYVIRLFWKWLIEVRGLPLANIARIKHLAVETIRWPAISFEDIKRIVETIRDDKFRRAVVELLLGEKVTAATKAAGIPWVRFWTCFAALRAEVGMPWLTPGRLRRAALRPLAANSIELAGWLGTPGETTAQPLPVGTRL